MTDISKFFTALSERAYKENDLSDVTYAMCEADLSFRQFFLDFFFPGQLKAGEVTIQREHSTDWGRPDFWIRTKDNKLYIVEVKIWDGSHHFEQYFNILNDDNGPNNLQGDEAKKAVWSRLGYIANYEIEYEVQEACRACDKRDAKDLCSVRTWKGFSEELKKYQSLNSLLVEAYAAYLARVCPYDDFKVVADSRISIADFRFVKDLDNAILTATCNHDIGLSKFSSRRKFRSCEWMGHFFEWIPDSGKPMEKVWGWLGVYYKKDGAVLCVEFEDCEGWGKLICDKWREREYVKDGFLRCYAGKAWDEDNIVDNAVSDFVSNVLKFVKEGRLNDITFEADEAYKSTKVLAMKALPFVLRDWLKGFIHGAYDVVLAEGSDAEVPQSHCGRYFEIRERGTDEDYIEGKNLFRGWIGALYNSACTKKVENGENYGDKPAFVLEVSRSFVKDIPQGWVENNWGWISYEIGYNKIGDMLANARDKLKNLLSAKEVGSNDRTSV